MDELENQPTPENQNGAPEPEDLEAIRAQLQAEGEVLRAEQSNLQAALTERDDRIAELEAAIEGKDFAIADLETKRGELESTHAQAVAKYLDAVRAANPTLPQDAVTGATVEDIDASVERTQAIADAVKANLASEAKNARVPAGAPTRAVNLEGLTADELIRLGISQGGNS